MHLGILGYLERKKSKHLQRRYDIMLRDIWDKNIEKSLSKSNFKASYFPKTSSQTMLFLSDFCGSMAGDQFSENDLFALL